MRSAVICGGCGVSCRCSQVMRMLYKVAGQAPVVSRSSSACCHQSPVAGAAVPFIDHRSCASFAMLQVRRLWSAVICGRCSVSCCGPQGMRKLCKVAGQAPVVSGKLLQVRQSLLQISGHAQAVKCCRSCTCGQRSYDRNGTAAGRSAGMCKLQDAHEFKPRMYGQQADLFGAALLG